MPRDVLPTSVRRILRSRPWVKPMADDWFCKIVGREIGPLSEDALIEMIRGGELGPDALVRGGGRSLWRPARQALGERLTQTGGVATATAGSTWFCRMLGDEFGPYTLEELKTFAAQGQLARADEIRDGNGLWRAAGDVPGLFAATDSLPARPTKDGFALDLDALDDASGEVPIRPTKPVGRPKATDRPRKKNRANDLLADFHGLEDAPDDDLPGSTDFDLDGVVLAASKPATSDAGRGSVSVTPAATAPAPAVETPSAERPPVEPPRRVEPAPVESRPAPEPPPAPSPGYGGGPSTSGFGDRPRVPVPPPPSKRKAESSGGSGLNLDFLKDISGQQIGIFAGAAAVLALVWFFWTGGISFSNGAGVYDQLVELERQYQTAKAAGTDSPQYQQFATTFKAKQTEMLKELGAPKSGSPAQQVLLAVRTFGYLIESPKAGLKKDELQQFEDGFAYQLATAGYAVGRRDSPPPPPKSSGAE